MCILAIRNIKNEKMKKNVIKLELSELSKDELKNISSFNINGSKGGPNTGGMSGPCGVEPDPSQMTPKEYAIAYQQWVICNEMYNNPEQAGNCIF